jgi:ATP-dependent Zn protease
VRNIIENAHRMVKKALEEDCSGLVHLTRKIFSRETIEGPELEATFGEPPSEADCK